LIFSPHYCLQEEIRACKKNYSTNMKENLFGKSLDELTSLVKDPGLPGFAARQISDWLYVKGVDSIDKMTNLSKSARTDLSEKYNIVRQPHKTVQVSTDGTRKYLFPAGEGRFVEAVYIPEKERATLCLSSQVGCKMGCLFCMTGQQGFQGQLSAGDIINQFTSLPEKEKISNIVYMGMGEPFDNLENVLKSLDILTSPWGYGMSPRRITVSTIGIIPAMKEFLDRSGAHLAVSLHSPFEEDRKRLMPVESVYSLRDVIQTVRAFDWGRQRRISFEYIMFRGINDTDRHVSGIIKLLNGIRCRVNLIRFHSIPDCTLQSSEESVIIEFRDKLSAKGVVTTIRASRGEDILAACGLLSTKELSQKVQDSKTQSPDSPNP